MATKNERQRREYRTRRHNENGDLDGDHLGLGLTLKGHREVLVDWDTFMERVIKDYEPDLPREGGHIAGKVTMEEFKESCRQPGHDLGWSPEQDWYKKMAEKLNGYEGCTVPLSLSLLLSLSS